MGGMFWWNRRGSVIVFVGFDVVVIWFLVIVFLLYYDLRISIK